MIHTDIQHTSRDGGIFSGRLAAPAGTGRLPGILLITAIFGVDDEMKHLGDAWAENGFLVSTPDIFWRQQPGPTADLQAGLARMARFDPVQGLHDIEDLLQALRAHPRCNGKVAVLGFCFGGRYAHLAAARLGANAAAAFHGTSIGLHLDEAQRIQVPISYHFGSADPVVPMQEVNAIRQAFAGKPNAEIIVHEGATHNFSMPTKPGYAPTAAKDAMDAALRCFQSM